MALLVERRLASGYRGSENNRTQGNVDLGVALAGATGGISSGFVVAASSFAVLALAGGALALALLPLLTLPVARTVRTAR